MVAEPLDVVEVALRVARALVQVGLVYFLGGSLASSIQGEPRATNDIDFVIDINEAQVDALAEELGPDFSVDDLALKEAVRLRASWNIYYLPTVTKIDLFIKGSTDFDASEFGRRRRIPITPTQSLFVKSPEDTVLRKLLWFREGGQVSTVQWRDVVEVLKVSGKTMENSYLDEWATRLKLTELLTKARSESERDQVP